MRLQRRQDTNYGLTALALLATVLLLALWRAFPGLVIVLVVCVGPRFWRWYNRLMH